MPLWILCLLWTSDVAPFASSAPAPRAEAMAAWDAGRPERALRLVDSLLTADPTDAVAAYWGMRIEETEGDHVAARCRALALEAGALGTPAALLAERRRRALERREADLLLERGIDAAALAAPRRTTLLLLPPEELGGGGRQALFGLSWTYLVGEALRATAICPVPVPSMLVVQELLRDGRAARAPLAASVYPVNTVQGLRARLSVLPGAEGSSYLESADGGWDDRLEAAILRFQRERDLPATGEADLTTQARIEEVLESWLDRPPAPVEPRHLSRAAELLGAASIVRGTYRFDEGQIEVSLAVLSADGSSRLGEPLVTRFRPTRAAEGAQVAAARIAERLGAQPSPAVHAWTMSPEELESATRSLLLMDRGLPRVARERWLRAPDVWFDWPLLRSARAALALSEEEADRLEAGLRRGWTRPSGLEPVSVHDRFSADLGLPIFGGSRLPEPSAHGVLGGEGILRVRGRQE